MPRYEGRLELTWTNKHLRLLAAEDGSYEWVSPDDYRVAEVRLLHDAGTYGAVAADAERARDNLLLRGNATNALAGLIELPEFAREYVGKVKLAYLDPPFNTQQSFLHYDDALEHSVWLTMMRDRPRSASTWVSSSSARARPVSRVAFDSASCSRAPPRFGNGLVRCPSRSWRRASRPARIFCPGVHGAAGLSSVRLRVASVLTRCRCYGPVEHKSVYFLTNKSALRIPAPPTMKNEGNYVASLSRLGRWLAEQAEEAGAMLLPETAAKKLFVLDGRARGVRTGDKGRGRDGQALGNFEPGSDLVAKVTVLAQGTQGHLTGVALDRSGSPARTHRSGRSA